MSYSYKVHRSIDEVDASVWQGICAAGGGRLSQDVRLIASLEKSLEGTSKFWHLVFYDEAAEPQACATLFTLKVDLAQLVERRLAAILRRLPRLLSRFRHVPVLLCGLPIDVGENALAIKPAGDSAQVLRLLDQAMAEIGKREKTPIVGVKEFTAEQLPAMDELLDLNFQRIPTLQNYILWSSFPDFDSYLGALRHDRRWEAKKSRRLLGEGGATVRVIRKAEEISEVYTNELHRLHLAVSDKAEYRLEILPREFFIELCQHFPDQTALILIERDSEVLGFLWTLCGPDTGYLLQAGMRYEVEHDIDLYFNLLYAGLDLCFSRGVSNIVFGQTAGHTKARLGCTGFPLFAYVKGVWFPFSFVFKHFHNLLAPVMPEIPQYRVFRDDPARPHESTTASRSDTEVPASEPVGTVPAG